MKTETFLDVNGTELIVKYRKSTVFFEKKYFDNDLREHCDGSVYIDSDGLDWRFDFSKEVFKALNEFLNIISKECWSNFTPKEIDSFGAEYDDYYDKEFDSNGSLRIGGNFICAEGPYAQPPNKEKITRLIKFNKRKFESFMFDFNELLKEQTT